MKTEHIDRIIEANPNLVNSREVLDSMQEGTYCIHRSWGFGKISGFSEERGMLLIDFEDGDRKGHAMDPVFCIDKLEVLPESHVLTRHRTNPEEVEKEAKKDPVSLIMGILALCDNECSTAREIEGTLSYLFGATKAKKWWANTKKLLV